MSERYEQHAQQSVKPLKPTRAPLWAKPTGRDPATHTQAGPVVSGARPPLAKWRSRCTEGPPGGRGLTGRLAVTQRQSPLLYVCLLR